MTATMIELPAHVAQLGGLFAERRIVRPKSMMVFFDRSTRSTRGVVMVDGRFPEPCFVLAENHGLSIISFALHYAVS